MVGNQLEIKKLFKELDFLKTDLEYKQECMEQINQKFVQHIGNIIGQRDDISVSDEQETSNNKTIDLGEFKSKNKADKRVKDVFRKIAKRTHPDVSKDLENYYKEANIYYENNDIMSLYLMCNELKIDFDFEENDISLIKEKIKKIRDSIEFIECSYAWQWDMSKTDKEKEAIIQLYIKDNL